MLKIGQELLDEVRIALFANDALRLRFIIYAINMFFKHEDININEAISRK